MPNPDEWAPVRARTVEEAIARGSARERIRTARGVRAIGVTLLVGGLGLLSRVSTWGRYSQAVGVHVHGGPSFTLSFAAIAGGVAVVAGPIAIGIGQWLVNRATVAAGENPVTASILDEPDP